MNKLEIENKLKDNKLIEGWKSGSLYKVCKVQGGFAFKSEEFLKDGIPLIKISNINDGSVKLEKNNSYVSNNRLKFYKSFIIKEGDILIALSGATVGKIGRIKGIKLSLLNQRVGRFIEYSNVISKKYLFYTLLKGEMLKYIINNAASSAQPNISPFFIENFKILFPSSLTEQCKITEILETIDETIEKTDAIIEKYKRIKQGLMQDLFIRGIDENGQIRSEETHKFKDSPLGRIPEEWGVVKLKDVVEYKQPYNYIVEGTKYEETGIPVLTAGKSFVLGYTNENEGIYSDVPVIIFDDFTTDSKFVNFPFKVKSSAMKFLKEKNKEEVVLKYIFENMQLIKYPSIGGDHKRRWISEFQNICIPLPPFPEQHHIVSVLSQIDETVEKEQNYKQKLERIKQGLMEDLLTGKVRVNHLIKEGAESV